MSEAEKALDKMRVKVKWLAREAGRQDLVGNRDTANHFKKVVKASSELLDGLAFYVRRNPKASKADLLKLLRSVEVSH
jgi:hypothetical protein